MRHRHDGRVLPRWGRGGLPDDSERPAGRRPDHGWDALGALDNFLPNEDGTFSETIDVERIGYANYFVARTGWDGDHKVCLVDLDVQDQMSLDTTFRDEVTGGPCVDFNRQNWPHGPWGNAKPHSMVFAVPEAAIR